MAAAPDLLARDPTAGTLLHRPDDRFVPLRPDDLAGALAADNATFGEDARWLTELATAIADVVDQEAGAFEHELCARYGPFNPDRDTIPFHPPATAGGDNFAELLTRIDYLLNKANFERLSDDQLRAVVRSGDARGVRVRLDPEKVRYIAVWVRGRTTTCVTRRTWREPLRGRAVRVGMFRRLVVVGRLRDDPNVLLKLFKDIPACDLEALLPHAEVAMSWFDRARALGGGAGAVGSTATKLVNLVTGIIAWTKILWVILIGAGVLAYRGIVGYRRARAARDSQRTRHLYFQSLDNNVGAIHALVTMFAQEEIKEALLAYAFCHARRPGLAHPSARADVDAADAAFPSGHDWLAPRVAAYLGERFGVEVDFDADDALRTLDRLNLWLDRSACRVIPPAEAVDRLRSHWRSHRTRHHHEMVIQSPLAK